MDAASKNSKFVTILSTLKQIQSWLDSPYPPQLIMASPTWEEIRSQRLPTHCRVTKRKIRGKRIPVRAHQRRTRKSPTMAAYWPEDELVENTRALLIIVLRGQPALRVADYEVHCQPGDFLFIPARIPRFSGKRPPQEVIAGDSQYDLALFLYDASDPAYLSLRICHFQNNEDILAKSGDACWLRNHFLGQILSGLGEYLQNNGSRKSGLYLLQSFISLFEEEVAEGHVADSIAFPSDSPLTRYQDPIETAQEYIRNHLGRSLSIDTVAHWVGLSRSVFTRRFRAATNQSFTEYLAEQRLERAKVLLTNTDFPIIQISERVGLQPRRLREIFHERHKCTPREFRLSQRKTQKGRI